MDSFGVGRFSPMEKSDDPEKLKKATARINLERGEKARLSLQKAVDEAFDENMSPEEIQQEIDLLLEALKKRRGFVE